VGLGEAGRRVESAVREDLATRGGAARGTRVVGDALLARVT
jgi:hypothetical protein